VSSGGPRRLLDALSAPAHAQQVSDGSRITSVERTAPRVVAGRGLITRVTVETDRLFEPALRDRNGALIHVTVKTRRLIYGNIDLGAYPKGNAARPQSAKGVRLRAVAR